MAFEAPKIDPRTAADVVAEVESSLEELTPWRRSSGGELDAGGALVRIFARFAELVIERLNQVPEKSFLAFLDLIGTRLEAPQPARVPLTFQLAAGSPDALVPAGTRVAALPYEGESSPPVFETDRDLVATRSRLVAAASREPGRDLWSDRTAAATGAAAGPAFAVFQGEEPIAHHLYLGHRALLTLPEEKSVTLLLAPYDEADPWPLSVAWEAWDGSGFQQLSATVANDGLVWQVTLDGVSALPESTAAEVLGAGFDPAALAGLGETKSAWLRGRWADPLPRSAGTPPQPRAPIDSVQVGVSIELGDSTLPELGFSTRQPLDLTRDFYPFGDKPQLGDAFYLANDQVLRPGATVRLDVNLSVQPQVVDGLVLAWEHWDGSEWRLLGESDTVDGSYSDAQSQFSDGTEGLVKSGPVSFKVPSSFAATEVNDQVRRWLRVRIAQGNYGVKERYVPVTDPETDETSYAFEPATYAPPVAASLRMGWAAAYDSAADPSIDADPDLVFSMNDFALVPRTAGEPFFAFTPTADEEPTFYLGFERPGDDVGFANRSAALYFAVAEPVFERSQEGAAASETAVVWEYWNGEAWKLLGTRDETAGFFRRGLVSFIGPSDFRAAVEFGRRAFWLRGRLERGAAGAARLARVLTNTVWASHAETITHETLGSSRGEPGQVFSATRPPILPGQELRVREPEMPPAAEIEELVAEGGDGAAAVERDAEGRPLAVWVRWHEVGDFYASGARSRHYTLDRLSGEVRFGDGRRGLVPPAGRGNVRLARYRTGGGVRGNRETGNVSQLKGSVPYVDGVVNHEPAAGGADRESLAAAMLRGPKTLRHRDRAVALADFEDLAYQASSQVARARGLPASQSNPGSVGLMILPKSATAQPIPSLELLGRVRGYVEARLQPTVDLWLAGPDWLRVSVRAEVVPVELERAADVRSAVTERLTAFLHPLSGGLHGDGWEFGRKPHRSDLCALVEGTPGVDHLRSLEVMEEPEEGGIRPYRFLVYSGTHQITLTGSTDEVTP